MTTGPYTDADVELVARAEFDADQRRLIAATPNPAAFEPTPWSLSLLSHVREGYQDRARAGLDALAAAGRLAPADDDPRHIIQFREDGWTIKHPLACRLGDLFGCSVNLAAEDLDGPPVPPGRYVVTVDGIDGRLRIGDRVDQDGVEG